MGVECITSCIEPTETSPTPDQRSPDPVRRATVHRVPAMPPFFDRRPVRQAPATLGPARLLAGMRIRKKLVVLHTLFSVGLAAILLVALRPASDGTIGEADVRITCGGGTYIRSLARDLARAVGSAAHLAALRRTQAGPFHVDHAMTLEALRAPDARPALLPALAALPDHPVQPLTADEIPRVVRGIDVPATVDGAWGALTHPVSGALVALAERRTDRWQPRVVMHEA